MYRIFRIPEKTFAAQSFLSKAASIQCATILKGLHHGYFLRKFPSFLVHLNSAKFMWGYLCRRLFLINATSIYFRIVKVYSIFRKNFQGLIRNLLVCDTVPLALVKVLVARYSDVEKNEDKFTQDLVEVIADIKQPMVRVISTAMKEQNRRNELQVSSWKLIFMGK